MQRVKPIYNKLFLSHLPDSLQRAIETAQGQHYQELYEAEADGSVALEDTLSKILSLIQTQDCSLAQVRFVWMSLIFAVVVEPTIKYYQPGNSIPKETVDRLTNWLLETRVNKTNDKKTTDQKIQVEEWTSMNSKNLFTEKPIASLQILTEALDVYAAAIKTLDPDHSLQALLDILDDCLEGYAIFPGSEGRRKLFEWWLWDVVPSSWHLRPPESICFLDDLKDISSTIYLNKLDQISSLIWSVEKWRSPHR